MHAVQIVSVPAGTTTRFSLRTAQPSFGGPQSRPDEQPAPQWLKEFGLCFARNMALEWEAPRKLQMLFNVQPNIPQPAVLTLLEQLFTASQQQEEERKAHLGQQIAHLILNHPQLFQQTPFGRQEAAGFVACITEEDTTWPMLERDYVRAEMMVDCWIQTTHLVEVAFVDGEKLQAEMRQAVRDPRTTEADDCATVRALVSTMLASEGGPRTKWDLLNASRQLHEMLLDSKYPKTLVTAMAQAMNGGPTASTAGHQRREKPTWVK